MRSLAPLAVLLALSLVIVSASAQTEEALEAPVYAPGDFWEYELDLPESLSLEEELETNVTVEASLRWTVQERTELTLNATTHEVYRIEGVLQVDVTGSSEIPSDSESSSTVTVSGTVTANHTVYVAVEGLEVLRIEAEFSGSVTISYGEDSTSSFGATLVVIGSANATFSYAEDTWAFPLEEGQQGREAFQVTGDVHAVLDLPAPLEDLVFDEDFDGPGTFERRVEARESVSVPAGTFDTWVVNTTMASDDNATDVGVGFERAYWADAAGAPVQRTFYDDEGQEAARLNLTSYHYAARAGFTILGVEAIVFFPAVAAVAVAAVVAFFLIRRRRPPQPQPVPPMELAPPQEPAPPLQDETGEP